MNDFPDSGQSKKANENMQKCRIIILVNIPLNNKGFKLGNDLHFFLFPFSPGNVDLVSTGVETFLNDVFEKK